MTMPQTMPGSIAVAFTCPASPAPQTGTGPSWVSETSFDGVADFNATVAEYDSQSGTTKGLVAEADTSMTGIDDDRYELTAIDYQIDCFSTDVLPSGSTLIVEFGVYSGGTFTALSDPVTIDVSPTGTDISTTSTLTGSFVPGDIGIDDGRLITHVRLSFSLTGTAAVQVCLDSMTTGFVFAPRSGWAPSYLDVFDKPSVAASVHRRLRAAKGRTLFLLVGDSTINHRGFGWEEGTQTALQDAGVPKWSTGLAQHGDSAATANNSSLGTGEQFSTHPSQDFISSPAPSSWASVASIRPFSRQTITYTGSAGNFRLRHNGYTDSAGTHTAATTDTADIAHNASASTIASAVQTAIGGLVRGTGGPLGTAPVTLEFYGATWAPVTLDLMTVRAPGSGSAITPTVALVEYSLGTGFPLGILADIAGSSVHAALTIRQPSVDLALDSTMDVYQPLPLSPSDALTAHHVYWGTSSSGSSRANVRKSADGNEAQVVTIDASGGTFTLTVVGGSGGTTGAQAYDVSAANLQTALRTAWGSSTINVYSPFSYRRRGYFVTMAEATAVSGELLLNAAAITPGVSDWNCERISATTWYVWTTGTGGTFKLSFGSSTTAAIAYDASTSTVQTALSTAGITATVTGHVRTNFYVYWSDAASKSLMTVNGASLTAAAYRAKQSAVTRFNDGGAGYAEAATTNLNSQPASDSAVAATVSVSAATRYAPLDSQAASAGADTTAKFLHLCQWIEKAAQTTGYGLHALVGKGGRGFRRMAESAGLIPAAWAAATVGTWYANATAASADGTAEVVFDIHGGVNDRNDSTNSIGPSPAASNTRAGVKDNLIALVAALNAVCDAASVPATRRWFRLFPSPPVEPDNATLEFVRLGMEDYSATNKRAVVVRTTEMCRDFPEAHQGFVVSQYPYSDTTATVNDPNHHLRRWYRTLAARSISAGFAAAAAIPDATSRQFRVRAPRGGRI